MGPEGNNLKKIWSLERDYKKNIMKQEPKFKLL